MASRDPANSRRCFVKEMDLLSEKSVSLRMPQVSAENAATNNTMVDASLWHADVVRPCPSLMG